MSITEKQFFRDLGSKEVEDDYTGSYSSLKDGFTHIYVNGEKKFLCNDILGRLMFSGEL